MSRAKRYNHEGKKLNIKKVVAVVIAFAVIIMAIASFNKLLKGGNKGEEKTVANAYFAVYTNNKWGVINSKGDIIITPEYDEAIIIPNKEKDVFICTYDVNYDKNTFKSKVINSKKEEIVTGYDTIQALENYDNNNNLWYESDVLVVSKDKKYGLVDFKGKELLACEYSKIEALKGVTNSILIVKDENCGLVDKIGATIIEPEYKEIKPISNKYTDVYIVTNKDGKKGVIGRDKKVALDVKYEDVQAVYGNGNFVAKEDGKWEIVNSNGEVFLRDKFSGVKTIDGENVLVISDKKYGVMNLEGENKINVKYEDMTHTFDNNYIFKEDGKYGIINTDGDILVKAEYDSIFYREDGAFFEANKSNEVNTYFIANDFNIKLTGILSELNIASGYMKVRVNEEYKYYNFKFEEKTSKELLKTNTLFLDKKDGKYGYVNKDGVVVVDYIYDDAREQNEFGFASVKKNGMWGAIDSKGKVVITPSYTLQNASLIEFINKWHRGEDLNLNYYTDK